MSEIQTVPRVLTICQPWAWAIAAGYKRVENRSWSTGYRGPLWIHAGLNRRWMHAVGELRDAGFDVPDDLVFGAVVAVCELVDVVHYDQRNLFSDLRQDYFASGPECWVLTRIRPLSEPLSCSGKQGLWKPAERTISLVEERLEC